MVYGLCIVESALYSSIMMRTVYAVLVLLAANLALLWASWVAFIRVGIAPGTPRAMRSSRWCNGRSSACLPSDAPAPPCLYSPWSAPPAT